MQDSERARALEQAAQYRAIALDAIAAWQGQDDRADDKHRRGVSARTRAELRSRMLAVDAVLLAVDPPPSGAGPQAEELRAANVANLREMVGMAGRHRETLLAVRECILALSPGHRTGYDWNADPLFLTLKEGRALNLIDDALKSTPASPQAETRRDCTCLGTCRGAEGLGPRWKCALETPAPVSPVEPEPPTTCRCLDCEPLTDPVPKPSEDDINRLEKAAWDSKTDLVLVWYRDRAEMFRQRLRETERAWQLDRKKPTVEPEPCVWRVTGGSLGWWVKPSCREGSIPAPWGTEKAVACHLCGAPLKVEREP